MWGYGAEHTCTCIISHSSFQLPLSVCTHFRTDVEAQTDLFQLSTQRNRSLDTTKFVRLLILYPYRSFQNTLWGREKRHSDQKFVLSQLSFIGSHNTLFSIFSESRVDLRYPQCIHRETGRSKRRMKVWVIHSLLTRSCATLRQTTIRAVRDSALVKYNPLQHCREWMVCWNIYFRMTTGLEIWQSLKWVIFQLTNFQSKDPLPWFGGYCISRSQ